MNEPRVVILVPLRLEEADPARKAAWDFTHEHLQEFGWPICTADSVGTWKRSEAINRAAKLADEQQEWDIAVIADADTIHNIDELRKAVAWAAKLQLLVVPWLTRYKLSQAGSERFMKSGPAGYTSADRDLNDHTRGRMPAKVRGGTTVVPRSVWERVGGFDEGFIEWGHEDVAFRTAALTLTPGRMQELRGTIYHLWHPRNQNHEYRSDNDERLNRYLAAEGSRVRMVELLQELGVLGVSA